MLFSADYCLDQPNAQECGGSTGMLRWVATRCWALMQAAFHFPVLSSSQAAIGNLSASVNLQGIVQVMMIAVVVGKQSSSVVARTDEQG